MMRKFIASQQLWSMMESTDLSSVDFVQMLQDYNTERGTAFELTSIYEYFATLENDDVKGRYVELLPPLKERVLNHLQLPCVESSYRSLLSPNYVQTLRIYKSASQARIRGELYGCAHSRNKKRSIALVRIRTCDGTNLEDTLSEPASTCMYRPAIIKEFCAHTSFVKNGTEEKSENTYMAHVSFLKEHPQRSWYGRPGTVQVWDSELEFEGAQNYVPIGNVLCRCAYTEVKLPPTYTCALAIVPLNKYTGIDIFL